VVSRSSEIDSIGATFVYTDSDMAASGTGSRDIEGLLALLDEMFVGPAWHGPSLRGAIRGVTHARAAARVGPGRHNINEVTVHAAYWKYVVRRRLTGDKRGSFAIDGSNWFVRDVVTPGSWRADIALLVNEHRLLCEAVRDLGPRRLALRIPGGKWTALETIQGAAAHDAYHAGQIQLLKRLVPAPRSS
jgi:DinB superfamily